MDSQNFNEENRNKERREKRIYLDIIMVLVIAFTAFIIYKRDVLFSKESNKANEKQIQNDSKEEIEQEEKDNKTNVNNETNIEVSEETVKRAYYLLVPVGTQYNSLFDKDLNNMAYGTINMDLYNGKKLNELTSAQKLTMALRYEDSISKFPICVDEDKSGTILQMTNFGEKIFKDTSFLKGYTHKTNLDIDS